MYIRIDNKIYNIVKSLNKKEGYVSIQNIKMNTYLVYDGKRLVDRVFRYDDDFLFNASFFDCMDGSFRLSNNKYITNKSDEFSDEKYVFDILEKKEKEIEVVMSNIDKLSEELSSLLKTIYNKSEVENRLDNITLEGNKL